MLKRPGVILPVAALIGAAIWSLASLASLPSSTTDRKNVGEMRCEIVPENSILLSDEKARKIFGLNMLDGNETPSTGREVCRRIPIASQ